MATQGPNFPTAATGNTNAIDGGTVAWINPTNIEANDGAFASATLAVGVISDDLIGTGFGFNIPANSVINGILLEVNYKSTLGKILENAVRLIKGGVPTGNKATGANLPQNAITVSYGGAADLWGTTWTAANMNAANFGAAFSGIGSVQSNTAQVDFFRITVFYSPINVIPVVSTD